MLHQSGLETLLAGYRGRPPANTRALIDTLLRVSQMACDLPWLGELDINLLLVDEAGVLALDAQVRLRRVGYNEPSRLAIRPYPSRLEQCVKLAGANLLLRPIRPEDAQRMMAFYAQATPEDMRLRFFMSRREVPLSQLARLTQIDYDREMSFIALETQADGELALVAEVRAMCDPDNLQAEFAIQVAKTWQGKGLGLLMLNKLVAYLREHGTRELVGQCLRDNESMKALASRAGLSVRSGPDPGLLTLAVSLVPAASSA
jgi:acetyltransferase